MEKLPGNINQKLYNLAMRRRTLQTPSQQHKSSLNGSVTPGVTLSEAVNLAKKNPGHGLRS